VGTATHTDGVDLSVERLTKDREADFLALMARDEHGSQCWCSAWWVPTWEGYGDQSPEERRAVRDGVFARDAHDGYLAYVTGAPVGWMQTGPRDDLPKIAESFELEADPDVWAVSCFTVLSPYRGQGLAHRFLAAVLDDLRGRGVKAVEGYPVHGAGHEAGEVWTGHESMFSKAGFTELGRGPRRAVYRLDLTA
jgi:GNAT superfamily N-acetyltransferase